MARATLWSRYAMEANMNNRIRRCWKEGRAAVNFWLSMPGTVSAETVIRQDFDGVTVDLQHGLIDYSSALPMLQVLSLGDATAMARVPWLEPGIIMKLLDAGALGIICPMVNNAVQAQRLVGYCRYAPQGERSFGPTRALPLHGTHYRKVINDELIILAMVETQEALDNVTDICSTDGLSGVYIGPSDLALSLGKEPKLDHEEPAVVDAIETILGAAKAAGIRAGIHCGSTAYAKKMITLGFDLVTIGSDIRTLSAGVVAALGDMRD